MLYFKSTLFLKSALFSKGALFIAFSAKAKNIVTAHLQFTQDFFISCHLNRLSEIKQISSRQIMHKTTNRRENLIKMN